MRRDFKRANAARRELPPRLAQKSAELPRADYFSLKRPRVSPGARDFTRGAASGGAAPLQAGLLAKFKWSIGLPAKSGSDLREKHQTQRAKVVVSDKVDSSKVAGCTCGAMLVSNSGLRGVVHADGA